MEDVVNAFGQVYAGRRVLVTGHTGFKGGWLSLWLHQLGASVSGLSLEAASPPNFFSIVELGTFESSRVGDIREVEVLREAIVATEPDIIFHLAAQPLVGVSYRDPLGTLSTNVMGTALLLEVLRELQSPAAVVVVTSDKCYRNDNSGRPFVESDPLGGHDIYSMSKAAAELVVEAWHASFFNADRRLGLLATVRAGNVIGGGDYAEDRIIPDAIRARLSGAPLELRRPQATRPWQHVLESASGYLAVGQRLLLAENAGGSRELLSLNFGPASESERSVAELVEAWLGQWPGAFEVKMAEQPSYGEAARLSLDHTLAQVTLGWRPAWNFAEAVGATAEWYRHRHEQALDDAAMKAFSLTQIGQYADAARNAGASWAIE